MGANEKRQARVGSLLNLRLVLVANPQLATVDVKDALDVAIQLMDDTSLSRYTKAVHEVNKRRNKYQRVKEAPQP